MRIATGEPTPDATRIFAPEVAQDFAQAPTEDTPNYLDAPARAFLAGGTPFDVALDLASTIFRLTSEGHPGLGYRVRARAAIANQVADVSFYLAPTPDGLRVWP